MTVVRPIGYATYMMRELSDQDAFLGVTFFDQLPNVQLLRASGLQMREAGIP
jgi:hypothetical protein